MEDGLWKLSGLIFIHSEATGNSISPPIPTLETNYIIIVMKITTRILHLCSFLLEINLSNSHILLEGNRSRENIKAPQAVLNVV